VNEKAFVQRKRQAVRESTTPVLVGHAEADEVIDGAHVDETIAKTKFARRSTPVAKSGSTSWGRTHHVIATEVLLNRDLASRAPLPTLLPCESLQLGFAIARVKTPSACRSMTFTTPNM